MDTETRIYPVEITAEPERFGTVEQIAVALATGLDDSVTLKVHSHLIASTSVWMIEEWWDDARYGDWRIDPTDGVFATEEAAQKYVDEVNARRLEGWLRHHAERDYDFTRRLDRWKAENFDVPEALRTPKPEQRMRKAEDFPETNKARIREFGVQA